MPWVYRLLVHTLVRMSCLILVNTGVTCSPSNRPISTSDWTLTMCGCASAFQPCAPLAVLVEVAHQHEPRTWTEHADINPRLFRSASEEQLTWTAFEHMHVSFEVPFVFLFLRIAHCPLFVICKASWTSASFLWIEVRCRFIFCLMSFPQNLHALTVSYLQFLTYCKGLQTG